MRRYLFVGQSGAGKTTMARLWLAEPGAVILSDDRIVLRSELDGVWMYGTPWHGDAPLASPRRARLARLFFLRHDTSNAITSVSGSRAAARLFAASFPPFHSPPQLISAFGSSRRSSQRSHASSSVSPRLPPWLSSFAVPHRSH